MFRIAFFCLSVLILFLFSFRMNPLEGRLDAIIVDELEVQEVLLTLGDQKPSHYMSTFDTKKAEIGESLMRKGQIKKGLFKSKPISVYFVCTDCHSFEKETADPSSNDPMARLDYAIENDKKFLPGSTFWGMYNRTSWYNGDYVKKYGDVITKAKNSLSEAVQVCAKYCSSGRYLGDWELEAILHYYKREELKIKDISITANDKKNLQKYNQLEQQEKAELITRIKSGYKQFEPATFLETMPREDRKYGEGGNAQRGKAIFDKACMNCHEQGRVTHLVLNDDQLTGRMFVKHLTDYTDLSLYQIIRYGTYSMPGRNQYMPQYTKEKMSDKQLNDLIAYIQELAK